MENIHLKINRGDLLLNTSGWERWNLRLIWRKNFSKKSSISHSDFWKSHLFFAFLLYRPEVLSKYFLCLSIVDSDLCFIWPSKSFKLNDILFRLLAQKKFDCKWWLFGLSLWLFDDFLKTMMTIWKMMITFWNRKEIFRTICISLENFSEYSCPGVLSWAA
jgi:hypothetical protein